MSGGVTGPFLTASWRRLATITWKVPDRVVAPLLPPGLELDRWHGSALASVLGFEFTDAAVLGVPAIGFRHFPEWNLRFYVRDLRTDRRGITFVQEMIPRALVSTAARQLYGEPYAAVPYEYECREEAGGFVATHRVKAGGGAHAIRVKTSGTPWVPASGSFEHFLEQVSWGFRERGGRRQAYRVEHAVWGIWPWCEIDLAARFEHLYGPDWAVLDAEKPVSKFVADGSPVEVFPPQLE